MTIAEAKSALFDVFSADDAGTPVDTLSDYVVQVFKGEPQPGVAPKPSALTIFTEGDTPTDYLFRVRIYQSLDTNALDAQDSLDGAIDAAGALLDAVARFGRDDWDCGYDGQIDALVAQTLVQVGREDFGGSQF